ncbi:hypothetical protein [Hymenobacter lapidiphilus]|uniref:Uncharacterized protein n=1 Tax=Hymenobacter lapidiphilus TaxID=2608003 RepID=A0A7Y7U718_9BACT|nr:hypothetical protein [Hymenobacter lapidiphilus]NVO33103.1 hypothetical protein [Hymenobacter lapidiphilus]
MAKTFKNLPRPSEQTAPKPTSERDFFDLSDDTDPVKKPIMSPKSARNTGNTGNSGDTGNTSNTADGATPVPAPATVSVAASKAPASARQTFVLSRDHLEQLRDYVHARRAQGDYTYSQKQALQEALDLLFAGVPPTAPRPAEAREQEQQRRQRIQQGQRGNSGK